MALSETEILNIYKSYYKNQETLLATVLIHSKQVARKALEIANYFPESDKDFIYEAAMLHDIGVIHCFAPSIGCKGELPYLCHGVEGKKMLDKLNMPLHGLVCERHIGSGLTAEEISQLKLPLPSEDMMPLSLEEKIICYADAFFSKSGDLEKEKSFEEVLTQMKKHGDKVSRRFLELHKLFSINPRNEI